MTKQFKSNLSQFRQAEVTFFFALLSRLLEESGWSTGDERLVFTAAQDGNLNFTIGQRHCLKLVRKRGEQVFEFINKDIIEEANCIHTFKGEPTTYLFETLNYKLIEQHWTSFFNACQEEYQRSDRSSFRTSNDEAFERTAFDSQYRDQLLAKTQFKPQFEMDFFSGEDVLFFQDRVQNNNEYRKSNDQDKTDGRRIKAQIFNKTNYWAKLLVENLGDDFTYSPDNRWNTSGYFKAYAWARVYLNQFGDQGYYFTLCVDGKTAQLIMKMDCQRTGTRLSKAQVERFDRILAENGIEALEINAGDLRQYDWEQLVGWSKYFIEQYRPTFERLHDSSNTQTSSVQVNTKKLAPLNEIFYGPPGTGKTFNSKTIAVHRLLDETVTDRKIINTQYHKLVSNGRVQFVTFHQSTSYEDFIEGIKPVMNADEEESNISYQIEDGIFKQMCVQASYEYIRHQRKAQAALKTLNFSQRYTELLNQFQERLEEGEQIEIPLKSGHKIEVELISNQGNFILRHKDGERNYTVSKMRLEKLDNAIDDFDAIPNIYSYFRSIIGGSNASAYWAILNQLYQVKSSIKATELPVVEDYSAKLQAYNRIDWQELDSNIQVPSYMLIIDEINRGNVAAIFGELITLLESDKRGGCAESLSATLPYSKGKLVVPPNLYVLGTMNTADRSVEALDTALRRRFAFTEVSPEPQLLSPRACIRQLWQKYTHLGWDDEPYQSRSNQLYEFLGVSKSDLEIKDYDLGHNYDLKDVPEVRVTGINLEKLLTNINNRIELLLDQDHSIGHAYFMGIALAEEPWEALKSVFVNQVLPLLQEYFYGDLGRIQLVLGRAFCEKHTAIDEGSVLLTDVDYDGEDFSDRVIYRIVDWEKKTLSEFQEAILAITS